MINLYWIQKNILDKLGLVFCIIVELEDTEDWPANFPKKIGLVSKYKYNSKGC